MGWGEGVEKGGEGIYTSIIDYFYQQREYLFHGVHADKRLLIFGTEKHLTLLDVKPST